MVRRRRWRDFTTPTGRRPVSDFIASLSDNDAAAVVAAMKEVAAEGPSAARAIKGTAMILVSISVI